MTKREAFYEACRGRNPPRYRVSARKRSGELVANGESDESWEAAFIDASKRSKT